MAGIPTESPLVLRESLRWVPPQPPYCSGGLRRGFTFGLSARRSFGREECIPCRTERPSLPRPERRGLRSPWGQPPGRDLEGLNWAVRGQGSSCHQPIDSGVSELSMPHRAEVDDRPGVDVIFDGGGTERPKPLRRAFFLLQLILETSGNLYAAPRQPFSAVPCCAAGRSARQRSECHSADT